MSNLKDFNSFVNEKLYSKGKPDSEANKKEFYNKVKLDDKQKKLISSLVDKCASEENIKKGINYKYLILGKLAGLDDKKIEELEKNIDDTKNEEFVLLVLAAISDLKIEDLKAFSEL